jgi:hypothetical protein
MKDTLSLNVDIGTPPGSIVISLPDGDLSSSLWRDAIMGCKRLQDGALFALLQFIYANIIYGLP